MQQTTILEKLKIVFELSKSSELIWAVMAFVAVFIGSAIMMKKKNIKKTINIYAIVYGVIFTLIVLIYGSSLGKMLDYMMNNLFVVIYFPNAAVYLAAIIISNIILCYSVFNKKVTKLIKNINLTVYAIIHYIFGLVLSVITNNNLDIFSQESLYGNKNIVALIEMSSMIFISWLLFLGIYKIIRILQKKNKTPVLEPVKVKQEKTLPANIIEVDYPKYVIAQPPKKTNNVSKQPPMQSAKDLREKEILEEKLKEAEETLRKQNDYLSKSIEARKILEERVFYLERHQQITTEPILVKEEKQNNKIVEENKKQEVESIKPKEVRVIRRVDNKQKPIDATTLIMKNFENTLTLEDYKILATMLKSKNRNEVAQEIKKATSDDGIFTMPETIKNSR